MQFPNPFKRHPAPVNDSAPRYSTVLTETTTDPISKKERIYITFTYKTESGQKRYKIFAHINAIKDPREQTVRVSEITQLVNNMLRDGVHPDIIKIRLDEMYRDKPNPKKK